MKDKEEPKYLMYKLGTQEYQQFVIELKNGKRQTGTDMENLALLCSISDGFEFDVNDKTGTISGVELTVVGKTDLGETLFSTKAPITEEEAKQFYLAYNRYRVMGRMIRDAVKEEIR